MNWCKPHWQRLKEILKDKGLDKFGPKNQEEALDQIKFELEGEDAETVETFDPLLGSWSRINMTMLESPACKGRILECPLCILVADGQPDTVENWLQGCTDGALTYAIEQGYIQKN